MNNVLGAKDQKKLVFSKIVECWEQNIRKQIKY